MIDKLTVEQQINGWNVHALSVENTVPRLSDSMEIALEYQLYIALWSTSLIRRSTRE